MLRWGPVGWPCGVLRRGPVGWLCVVLRELARRVAEGGG